MPPSRNAVCVLPNDEYRILCRLSTTEGLLETKAERVKQLEQEERSLNETVTNMKQITETTAKKLDERTRALDSAQAQVSSMSTLWCSCS